jgi:hypothetical protein
MSRLSEGHSAGRKEMPTDHDPVILNGRYLNEVRIPPARCLLSEAALTGRINTRRIWKEDLDVCWIKYDGRRGRQGYGKRDQSGRAAREGVYVDRVSNATVRGL